MSDHADKDHAAVRFPPPFVFLGLIGVGTALHRWLVPLDPGVLLPSWLPLGLGVTLVIAGFLLILLPFRRFKETGQEPEPWTTTPEIIVDGIYRYTRNPMYVGMSLIQAGVGIWTQVFWITALVPLSMILVYLIAIRHEEVYLEEKFGDSYRSYKTSVRRWL